MSEQEMFKQMELGNLMAEDVLPAVGRQFSKVANQNDALASATQKVNSQYQRFLSAIQHLQKEMFEGGFGKAMGETFGALASYINQNKTSLVALGNAAVGVFQAFSASLWIVLQPLQMLSTLIGVTFGENGAKWVGIALGVGYLIKKIVALKVALVALNAPLLLLYAKIFAITALVTAAVQGLSYLLTGKTFTANLHEKFSASGAANTIAQSLNSSSNTTANVNVVIEPNDSEFGRAINARYDQRQFMARTQMEAEVLG